MKSNYSLFFSHTCTVYTLSWLQNDLSVIPYPRNTQIMLNFEIEPAPKRKMNLGHAWLTYSRTGSFFIKNNKNHNYYAIQDTPNSWCYLRMLDLFVFYDHPHNNQKFIVSVISYYDLDVNNPVFISYYVYSILCNLKIPHRNMLNYVMKFILKLVLALFCVKNLQVWCKQMLFKIYVDFMQC